MTRLDHDSHLLNDGLFAVILAVALACGGWIASVAPRGGDMAANPAAELAVSQRVAPGAAIPEGAVMLPRVEINGQRSSEESLARGAGRARDS